MEKIWIFKTKIDFAWEIGIIEWAGGDALWVKILLYFVLIRSDDEVLAAGGMIAKYSKAGKNVIVVIFSSGELSNPLMKEEVIIKERIKETKKVGKFLGVKETILFGISDRTLVKEVKKKKTLDKVEEIIHKYKPFKIFTHSHSDLHKDHRAVFNIVDKIIVLNPIYFF